MIPRHLLDQANAILERLFLLDDAVANAYAFRFILEDLNGRNLALVQGRNIMPVAIVRAGMLRAEITAALALLDASDARGNRASIGQILTLLDTPEMQSVLVETRTVEYGRLKDDYSQLRKSEAYQRGVRLRNDAVAHLLDMPTPTPTVEYSDIFGLIDEAAGLVLRLYAVCGRNAPRFPEHELVLKESATLFWSTYFDGLAS